MLSFEPSENQSLKGLRWHSQSDSFGFQVNPLDVPNHIILSEVALSVRDLSPLGGLSIGIRLLALLQISRTFDAKDVVRRELHGFCDASELDYGAVIYLRVVDKVDICLLCAKSKVTPLRPITLPRLVLLLSNLIAYIRQVLQGHLSFDAEHAWSIPWSRRSGFDHLRIGGRPLFAIELRAYRTTCRSPPGSHVDTEHNPADLYSRGLTPCELMTQSMWWTGPEWLIQFEPRVDPTHDVESFPIEEERISNGFLDRFSLLNKICRILAYCLRFWNILRAKSIYTTLAVDQMELHSALLILVIQSENFGENIEQLQKGDDFPNISSRSLSRF
ncbi:hypothetical protein ACFW04_013689 [Cataglyphis niger]